jgi:ATP-dependent Zn protease
MAPVHACQRTDGPPGSAQDLEIIAPTLSYSANADGNVITTMGSLKNSSANCLEHITIEVNYFDAQNTLIDTVTDSVYATIAPPKDQVSFRVSGTARMPKEAYASQKVRVLFAEPRVSRQAQKKEENSFFVDLFVSWFPMLLLIALWIFFMQRMQTKNSPQGKQLEIFEKQNAILEAQNALLARIANAVENKAARDTNAP